MVVKNSLATLLICLLSWLGGFIAAAETGYETGNVILFQRDNVLQHRITSVDEVSDYIKRLEQTCKEHFKTADKPLNLTLVMAVKSGGKSRAWFIPSKHPDGRLEVLKRKLEGLPTLKVYGGPFAIGLSGKVAGGVPESDTAAAKGPILPQEWKDAIKDRPDAQEIPDGPLAILWPDEAGQKPLPKAPKEFVTQALEPTGGKIERPKDWIYREGHRESVLMWTISLEDSKDQRYTTGTRIQAIIGVEKKTGKTAKEFIDDFVKAKKASKDVKVLKTCEPSDQGLFSRICLEVLDGPDHIIYSLFWGNQVDMAVLMISGTTKELWPVYSDTFNRMNQFELIGAEWLKKQAAK